MKKYLFIRKNEKIVDIVPYTEGMQVGKQDHIIPIESNNLEDKYIVWGISDYIYLVGVFDNIEEAKNEMIKIYDIYYNLAKDFSDEFFGSIIEEKYVKLHTSKSKMQAGVMRIS